MKRLSGHTEPYAVLGHPIGHTLSPVMHNASFAALGRDAVYLAFDVHPDRLLTVLPAMRDMGFLGVNLTVPLKEIAFRDLEHLDESARLVGAVNTVAFTEKGLEGHNTDGYGFLRALQEAFGAGVQGDRVFVLGTGGAGRAVALVCAREGAAAIALKDVDRERALQVAAEIRAIRADLPVDVLDDDQTIAAAQAASLIIQSTPVGMKPSDPVLLPAAAFHADQRVFDLIYMFPETALLNVARTAGAQVANGLGMLLHQGARAFTIWSGTDPDIEAMRRALETSVYGNQ